MKSAFRSGLALAATLFVLNFAGAFAQEGDPPGPDEKPPEKKAGALKARPEDDPAAAAFVAKLAPARPQMAGVAAGRLVRHVLSPDGAFLYYFRDLNAKPAARPKEGEHPKLAENPRYVLYRVGTAGAEQKVLETGYDAIPPLFLPDGRLLVVTRRIDLNGDGAVDYLDERALVACNADGVSEHEVCVLRPNETPLAAWRQGKEVLLADYSREDVNGWIMTLALGRGQRTALTRGFNVSVVLEDGTFVVERFVAPSPQAERPNNPWARRFGQPEDAGDEGEAPPEASLLDHCEHVLFNPADGSETKLFTPSQNARLCVYGEGSFFGYQQATRNLNPGRMPNGMWRPPRSLTSYEIVIVDDKDHSDTRAPQARDSYMPLAWISGKGLLALDASNLKSRLVLMDRSSKLNMLPIAEFGFDAQGFCASLDGLTVAWLTVEDTNEDGYLDPWRDDCRVWFLQIAPRE